MGPSPASRRRLASCLMLGPPTYYWPATRSPAVSLAVKSNRSPQLGQNPAVRPGLPPWRRPTGLSQRVQKRRRSGTLGSAMTTAVGSADSIGAISMMPAPTRLRRDVPLPVCVLRLVSRDTSTRPEVRPVVAGRADGAATVPDPLPEPLPVPLVAGAAPLGGAMPQVSQYPSAMVPEQPARPHAIAVMVFDPLSAGWSARGTGGGGRARGPPHRQGGGPQPRRAPAPPRRR